MARQKIANLHDDEYEHPFDHKALEALEKTPMLDTTIKKVWERVGEDFLRVYYTGSSLRITEKNYPDLMALHREAYDILNMTGSIGFYMAQDPYPNAFTIGVTNPVIVLTTKLVDLMQPDEILFVIGHEMGHIKSRHMLYQQTAEILTMLGSVVGDLTLGVGNLVTYGVRVPLLYWSRMAEFTADRAGLLACQDISVATSVNMKFAGIPEKYCDNPPVETFLEQAEEFKNLNEDTLNKTFRLVLEANPFFGMTHPWTVLRAAELLKWQESGGYGRVLARETYDPATMGSAVTGLSCAKCGAALSPRARFCKGCGTPVAPPAPSAPVAPACPSCGALLSPDDAFCPECGRRVAGAGAPLLCRHCGAPLRGGEKFCGSCGQRV
ncbi:MAG: M48 family metallopeptidase [Methanolinea sp.]|jgi:Zn-dependent protease with chaperone function/RNA polymerase subunit RPABC4/transcription elongation factor Spt4|nr:M48 family metallopeptidase [Methanolinea sp.]